MLILHDIHYVHPHKDVLFSHVNLALHKGEKVALVGNNGIGKSTLLKIIAGVLAPSSGSIKKESQPFYVPQVFGQYDHLTLAEALGVQEQLNALQEILAGNVTDKNLAVLNDDWTLEERCHEALQQWKLEGFDLERKMSTLSGGQKTRVFLAGIFIHQPGMVLLDEPSNHLDKEGRTLLYDFVRSYTGALLVVSHDRTLLNMQDKVYELSAKGTSMYGGNYDFYAARKKLETEALGQDIKSKEKALKKARETERETIERQQKLDARGKKKQEKAGLPTISMNTFKNNAEKSTSRIKGIHAEKTGAIVQELHTLKQELPGTGTMKFGFDHSHLHRGKVLVTATGINMQYGPHRLWKQNLDFQLTSGERLVIRGLNGAGKTTLVNLMLGKIYPSVGIIHRIKNTSVYIDQDYSLIHNELSIYRQAEMFNRSALPEHEIRTRLNRFLFTQKDWDKPCAVLSGGERMRLMLCCLTIGSQAPDMIILDEPTNNLDLQNIEILTTAINEYQGTLVVISHDEHFLSAIQISGTIQLE